MKSLSFAVLLAGVISCNAVIAQTAPAGAQPSGTAQTTSAAKTEEQPAFLVIGISARTSTQQEASGDGEIPKLWQRFMREGLIETIPSRTGGGMVAVYSDFAKSETAGYTYTYTVGARVTSADKIPDGFVAVTVPAGKYAVVTTDPGALPEILPKAWHRIFAMSPEELGGARAHKVDYEQFPENLDWQNTQVDIHLGLK
jgi:predicted transcriptional regulator YdeE